MESTSHIKIKKISSGKLTDAEDELAVEEPLEIQMAWQGDTGYTQKNISVTMRTPGNDEELAAGFVFTEGIVQHIDQIKHIQAANNTALIMLAPGAVPQLQQAERNFYTT